MTTGLKSSKRWLIGTLLLIALGAGLWWLAQERRSAQAAAPVRSEATLDLTASDVITVRELELAQGLAVSGVVRAANSALIKARVAGELRELTLREGDAVKSAQVVARIDAPDLAARLKQARDQAEAARAQIDLAQRQFDNNQALVNQGFISRTALDASLANLQTARANHEAALASVDLARKSQEDTVLRSPIAGWVSQRLAQPGERVAIDARILEVVDLNRLELEVVLTPAEAIAAAIGQSATLVLDDQTTRRARVLRVSPSAQAGSRGVPLYLGLDEPKGLRPGLFMQGRIDTGTVRTLAVPLDAVRTDKPAPYVQMVVQGRVRHRDVVTGAQGVLRIDGQELPHVAVPGLATGDVLLAGPVGSVREGTAVRLAAGSNPGATARPDAAAGPASAR